MRSLRRRQERRKEQGVALVEFALVAPLLFLLLFGIVEFGWAFVQYLDVRHGAREGARLAAVNYQLAGATGTTQADQIIDETCARMDSAENATITVTVPGTSTIGSRARVQVSSDLDTLTGFLDGFLGGVTLTSDVDIRIEQEATWVTRTKTCPTS
jgi:Flp pilus assembly protein TadG